MSVEIHSDFRISIAPPLWTALFQRKCSTHVLSPSPYCSNLCSLPSLFLPIPFSDVSHICNMVRFPCHRLHSVLRSPSHNWLLKLAYILFTLWAVALLWVLTNASFHSCVMRVSSGMALGSPAFHLLPQVPGDCSSVSRRTHRWNHKLLTIRNSLVSLSNIQTVSVPSHCSIMLHSVNMPQFIHSPIKRHHCCFQFS